MSRATWDVPRLCPDFAYGPFTLCGAAFLRLPLSFQNAIPGSLDPAGQVRRFGLLPVRSPLLGESLLFSSPPANEMFHFTGLAAKPYGFRLRWRGIAPAGFSHSDISGSKPVCGSPKLFAACHVLRRLPMPRHPSCALSNLAKSSWTPSRESRNLAGMSIVTDSSDQR